MSISVSLRHRLADFSMDLAFDAPDGVTVLFGPSGSGKSTVLNAVAGLLRPQAAMQAQARRLAAPLQAVLGEAWTVSDMAMSSQIGSGAIPVDALPSWGLVLRFAGKGSRGRALGRLEASLRALPRPVIGRIADDALWLDLRCMEAADEAGFVAQLDGLRA